MQIIAPGSDVIKFASAENGHVLAETCHSIEQFLYDKNRPALIVLARPVRQKNILETVHLFAQTALRERATLILILGQREDIATMDSEQRQLLTELLLLIDKYDLYGLVAYPKHHLAEAVPALYQLVAQSKGLLIQLSQYENFGLTLVEAAAAGVPVVSSGMGGAAEVLEKCNNGIVIDAKDHNASCTAILQLLDDSDYWHRCAENGKSTVHRLYTWPHHVDTYLTALEKIRTASAAIRTVPHRPLRFVAAKHLLVCDIDDTLTGDAESIATLNTLINYRNDVLFGIATGRNLTSALKTLTEWNITEPDFFITAVGTAIHYNFGTLREDNKWLQNIRFRWRPQKIRQVLDHLPGLTLQEPEALTPHKISYYYDPDSARTLREMKRLLRQNFLQATVLLSRNRCLDVIPTRASKGHAMRYLAWKWQFDLSQIIAAGDSGNDSSMLSGHIKGIVVANYSDELEDLRHDARIYFSTKENAAGILDGLKYYGLSH